MGSREDLGGGWEAGSRENLGSATKPALFMTSASVFSWCVASEKNSSSRATYTTKRWLFLA